MIFLLPAVLTAACETVIMRLFGYKGAAFTAVCICANSATNSAVNLILAAVSAAGNSVTFLVYPLEALAILAETGAYTALLGRKRALLGHTAAANLFTFLLGIALFGHV